MTCPTFWKAHVPNAVKLGPKSAASDSQITTTVREGDGRNVVISRDRYEFEVYVLDQYWTLKKELFGIDDQKRKPTSEENCARRSRPNAARRSISFFSPSVGEEPIS